MRTPANDAAGFFILDDADHHLGRCGGVSKGASVVEGNTPVRATSSVIHPEGRNRSREDADLLDLDRRAGNLEPNQSLAADPIDRETSLGVCNQLKWQTRSATIVYASGIRA